MQNELTDSLEITSKLKDLILMMSDDMDIPVNDLLENSLNCYIDKRMADIENILNKYFSLSN
jgi:hypothetical protein